MSLTDRDRVLALKARYAELRKLAAAVVDADRSSIVMESKNEDDLRRMSLALSALCRFLKEHRG